MPGMGPGGELHGANYEICTAQRQWSKDPEQARAVVFIGVEPGRPHGTMLLWGIRHLPGFDDVVYVTILATAVCKPANIIASTECS